MQKNLRYFTKIIILILVFRNNNGNASEIRKKPNIIVIVADDMGFNDVSFHGSDEIPTPNIDALAYNGVILNSHYTQALCTPSRASLLTGKYPIHLGMQHLVILEPEPWGLPLNETILPEYLKRNGYTTRAIGKWHLGFFKKEYTPIYRGFDSHYGYWQGYHDYYDHTIHATYSSEYGYDMRNNMSINWDAKGKYSTTLFTDEAIRLIHEHNTDNPLFMYFAHLAPHAGNDWDPLQAPDEEINKFSHIEDPERRVYAAMVSMLDHSVGAVVTALREKRMLNNSIIIFMSDNGAAPQGIHANHGSNYPFRGGKSSVWEGGLRNIAAIWSPLIKKPQRISNNLMHITDWLPTLYSAAGLNHSELPANLDGKDQWKTISENDDPPRKEILLNIDDNWKFGGILQSDWKYLYGSGNKGRLDQWYGNNGKNPALYSYSEMDVLKSPVGYSISGLMTFRQIKRKNTTEEAVKLLKIEDIQRLRIEATVTCSKVKTPIECNPILAPCLFNIKEDPCETRNLVKEQHQIVARLKTVLDKYRKTAYPMINIPRDPNADPAKHNGVWTNWQDTDVIKEKIAYNELSNLAISIISVVSVIIVLVVIILLLLTFRKKSLKRTHSKRLYELADIRTTTDVAAHEEDGKTDNCFEEREKQLRTSLRDEFREV